MATNQEKNKDRESSTKENTPMEQRGRSDAEKSAGTPRRDDDRTQSTRPGSKKEDDIDRDDEDLDTQRGDRGKSGNR